MTKATDKVAAAFESGHGVGWDEHDHDLYCGTERFFRPGYMANLVSSWIPALDGVPAKLTPVPRGQRPQATVLQRAQNDDPDSQHCYPECHRSCRDPPRLSTQREG